MLIHDYDLKSLAEDLKQYINIGGSTLSIVITDDFYFKKRSISDPYHVEIQIDHITIYLNGQDPNNVYPLTDEYTGWFYYLIKSMYIGMLYIVLDEKTCYIDRLTKGILKLLPSNYLNNFEIGDANEG